MNNISFGMSRPLIPSGVQLREAVSESSAVAKSIARKERTSAKKKPSKKMFSFPVYLLEPQKKGGGKPGNDLFTRASTIKELLEKKGIPSEFTMSPTAKASQFMVTSEGKVIRSAVAVFHIARDKTYAAMKALNQLVQGAKSLEELAEQPRKKVEQIVHDLQRKDPPVKVRRTQDEGEALGGLSLWDILNHHPKT